MNKEAESFIKGLNERAEHLSGVLMFGGETSQGTFFMTTSKSMWTNLKALKQMRRFINESIKELESKKK